MTASVRFAAPVTPTPTHDRGPGRIDWHIGDLITGKLRFRVPVLSPSWSLVMDDAGALSCTLPLSDPDIAAIQPYVTAAPGKAFLAVGYTDPEGTETFLQGGPIWTHAWDDSTRQLAIGAGGMWSYFDHRKLIRVLAANENPALVAASYSGVTLGTIAKRLVELAQSHTGGQVPVLLPGEEAGTATRLYPGYELGNIGAALRDLTQVDGGPEIQFRPRRSNAASNFLVWDMLVGTAAAPLLAQPGADWTWDASAARTAVSGINVNRDGTATGGRAWSVGAGDAEAKLISRSDDPALIAAGYPLLEVDEARDGVEIRATLNGYSAALLTRSKRPVETWTMTVRRDETPRLGSYLVGHWARLRVADHPYIPTGDYRTRITGISGDNGDAVAIQLQPTNAGGLA